MVTMIRRCVLTVAVLVAIFGFAGGASAQVAAADAQPFIGDWNVAVEGDAPVSIRVTITDNAGQVAASVTGAEGNTTAVTKITKNAESLLLDYITTLQGTQLPVVITLTPAEQGLGGTLDLAGGMFTAPLKATKR